MLVSILVLMEVCLEEVSHFVTYFVTKSFNPCFNGSVFRRLCAAPSSVKFNVFQSLF